MLEDNEERTEESVDHIVHHGVANLPNVAPSSQRDLDLYLSQAFNPSPARPKDEGNFFKLWRMSNTDDNPT